MPRTQISLLIRSIHRHNGLYIFDSGEYSEVWGFVEDKGHSSLELGRHIDGPYLSIDRPGVTRQLYMVDIDIENAFPLHPHDKCMK